MYERMPEELEERYTLSMDRIRQIETDGTVPAPYADFFVSLAGFIVRMDRIRRRLLLKGDALEEELSLQELAAENREMYEDILPENYSQSYANPAFAAAALGEERGRQLCYLASQVRALTGYIFDGFTEAALIHLELFLEIYNRFEISPLPDGRELTRSFKMFACDSCDVLTALRVRQSVVPYTGIAHRIVMESDLSDPRYLYRYGEYVTENELKLSAFMNSLSEEKIESMARTFTEGYRVGFVRADKDLSKKKTVNIRYPLGLERMVRCAVRQFAQMGLEPVIYRRAMSRVNMRGNERIGYTGAAANLQYDYDHREDAALYLDRRFMDRRLSVMRRTFEQYRGEAKTHAGPAVIETFGEEPFAPEAKAEALQLDRKQAVIQTEMNTAVSRLTNQYIPGDERSFTIIAFPVPGIGPDFEEIFAQTIRINTLDEKMFEKIQQAMIDVLDKGCSVHILGRGKNRTDLTVALADLKDPARQTLFENCLADVNIPAGEVFTSPKLEGTNGILHITRVYLQGLDYHDLFLRFADGMVADYGCANFSDPKEGREYVRANVLFHHDTLPMGEFAIGTNTAAYVMAEKFDIGARMPILIAEKTGPHFAVGDTCYSWSEDLPVYNPDGKEIIARDNSVSLLRKEDPSKAYFGCHTDITIPYSELGLIEVITKEGDKIPVIRDGRFVLPGTLELNAALEEE